MLVGLLNNVVEQYQVIIIGILFACVSTLAMLKCEFKFLPQDQGREFAVNGELSKGKIRGVGIIMVACFIFSSILFIPVTKEYVIYAILLFAMMLSGYLDDMSKIPWSDYKKGLIDFVISLVTVIVFIKNNSTDITVFGNVFHINPILFGFLAIVLLWVSINVTNCSDGVDGLCSSLSIVTLFSFAVIFPVQLGDYKNYIFLMVGVLLAYLYFNTSPSTMLMGDAGSRAIGFFIALIAMKSGHPISFVGLALLLIIDGGLGLVKIFLLRFLKISILKNTRTPIHDEMRKNKGWSDTQVVYRFLAFQIVASVICYLFIA
ncbi:MAG: phospho-N-acetylmuramoyl-pentapeptide-transferase [Lachnospiraceae bacterium]|nr:phospho-N-acetylmuramoyl-pentapeptide-transferase [Lachnospiraceae bacterium]